MFSLNDIDRLLEIKDLIDQGVNMAGIKQLFLVKEQQAQPNVIQKQAEKAKRDLTDEQLRNLLRNELMQPGRFNRSSFVKVICHAFSIK